MENVMEKVFEIISFGGTAKGMAYEALQAAEQGDMEKADELMNQAEEELTKAHWIQTELIGMEARGEKIEIGPIFVHAQDHLMTAIEAKSLISHMITMYKTINEIKKQ